MASFADCLKNILISDAVLLPKNGALVLEDQHQEVLLRDAPCDLVAVDIRKFGKIANFKLFKENGWEQACDYLLAYQADGRDCAILIELKKTLGFGSMGKGMDQLRWSRPLLDYLRSVCEVLDEERPGAMRISTGYALIIEQYDDTMSKTIVRDDPNMMERERCNEHIDIYIAEGEVIAWKLLADILAATQSAEATR